MKGGAWQGKRGWNHSPHSGSQPPDSGCPASPVAPGSRVPRHTEGSLPLLGEELTPGALSLLFQHRPRNLHKLTHAHLPLSLPLPGSSAHTRVSPCPRQHLCAIASPPPCTDAAQRASRRLLLVLTSEDWPSQLMWPFFHHVIDFPAVIQGPLRRVNSSAS